MVDMSARAVTERLLEVSRQQGARERPPKAVDMARAAVTARLSTLGALSDMCRRLGTIDLSRARTVKAPPGG